MKSALALGLGGLACVIGGVAGAHSASDAYLTLTSEQRGGRTVLHGQWDVALRDLDFVIGLDADGDGRLTWKEVRTHSAAIEQYVYPHLRFVPTGTAPGVGAVCSLQPGKLQVDEHADGAYAVLFFEVTCTAAPRHVQLSYDLFFAIDPSHRGIFVIRNGGDVGTAVISPDNSKIEISI